MSRCTQILGFKRHRNFAGNIHAVCEAVLLTGLRVPVDMPYARASTAWVVKSLQSGAASVDFRPQRAALDYMRKHFGCVSFTRICEP